MNRKLVDRDKINPKVAAIRQQAKCLADRAQLYLDLLFDNLHFYNPETKEIATEIYKNMRVDGVFSIADSRPIIAGIVYYASVMTGDGVRVDEIREILKPLAGNIFRKHYKDVIAYQSRETSKK